MSVALPDHRHINTKMQESRLQISVVKSVSPVRLLCYQTQFNDIDTISEDNTTKPDLNSW